MRKDVPFAKLCSALPYPQNPCNGQQHVPDTSLCGCHRRLQKNGARINGATNQTLELPSSSSEDEGNYTVVAENSAGITTSPIMRVVVLVPPTIKLTTVAPLSAIVGEMIAMEVHVEGNPRPDVHWKINGVLIPGESSHYIKFIPTESMLGDLQITVRTFACTKINSLSRRFFNLTKARNYCSPLTSAAL